MSLCCQHFHCELFYFKIVSLTTCNLDRFIEWTVALFADSGGPLSHSLASQLHSRNITDWARALSSNRHIFATNCCQSIFAAAAPAPAAARTVLRCVAIRSWCTSRLASRLDNGRKFLFISYWHWAYHCCWWRYWQWWWCWCWRSSEFSAVKTSLCDFG